MKFLKYWLNRVEWDAVFWVVIGAIMVYTNMFFILDFVFTAPFPDRYFAPLLVIGVIPGMFLGLALMTRMVTSIIVEND